MTETYNFKDPIEELSYEELIELENVISNKILVNSTVGQGSKITDAKVSGNMEVVAGQIQSANYVLNTSGWRLTPTSGEFNFAVSVDLLDIPDITTANSFHVDNQGNAWWGCNNASFIADPNNATAYILKTGVTKFATDITGARIVGIGSTLTLYDVSVGGTNPVTGATAQIIFTSLSDPVNFIINKRRSFRTAYDNVLEIYADADASSSRFNWMFLGRRGDEDASGYYTSVMGLATHSKFELDHYNAANFTGNNSHPLWLVVASDDISESTGIPITYTFTITCTVSPTAGSVYSNNSYSFTVVSTSIVAGAGTISAYGTGVPEATGMLTKVSGTGDPSIAYSANTANSIRGDVGGTREMMFFQSSPSNNPFNIFTGGGGGHISFGYYADGAFAPQGSAIGVAGTQAAWVQMWLNTEGVHFGDTVDFTYAGSVMGLPNAIYGSGKDGADTITEDETLTSDKFYTNLTINTGVTLYSGGYRIFVSETLTINGTGTISCAGSNGGNGGNGTRNIGGFGSAGTAGIGGAANYLAGGFDGKTGGSGSDPSYNAASTAAAGIHGTAQTSARALVGAGAAGGGFSGYVGCGTRADGTLYNENGATSGAASNGGAAASTSIISYPYILPYLTTFLDLEAGAYPAKYTGGGGSGSGGGGCGASYTTSSQISHAGAGGGGGGSGGSGGILLLFANRIVMTGSGSITVAGGNGGNGGNGGSSDSGGQAGHGGGGSGGGGGNGGVLVLVYSSFKDAINNVTKATLETYLHINGGTKGTGGIGGTLAGYGSGGTGADGTNGSTGKLIIINSN